MEAEIGQKSEIEVGSQIITNLKVTLNVLKLYKS